MAAGSAGIMQADFTWWAIVPVHVAAVNGGRGGMSSHDMTERRRDHKRERGETIALGVKCRILDFSQQCCSIDASHWQQPSQTCLCADVGELWEHVFFLSFFFWPRHWLGMLSWAGGGYSNILSDANDPLMMRREIKSMWETGICSFLFLSLGGSCFSLKPHSVYDS